MTSSNCWGTSGWVVEGRGGGVLRCACNQLRHRVPGKGGSPVRGFIQHTGQRVDVGAGILFRLGRRDRSGAMYGRCQSCCRTWSFVSRRARGRSRNQSDRRSRRHRARMLDGLMSRWIRPTLWAACSGSGDLVDDAHRAGGIQRPVGEHSFRSRPSMSRMSTRVGRRFRRSRWIGITCGLSNRAAAWASRRNRR